MDESWAKVASGLTNAWYCARGVIKVLHLLLFVIWRPISGSYLKTVSCQFLQGRGYR